MFLILARRRGPVVPCSKPMGGSKFDSAFQLFSGKKVNCLLEVALALRQLNPIYKKVP